MPRRQRNKRKERTHKVIGFKAYHDTDADLLAWWDSIREGERSDMLRSLLRAALGYQQFKPQPINQFETIQNDLTWLRDALNDLPSYMEHIIQEVAAHTANHTLAQIKTHAVVLQENRLTTNGHHNGTSVADSDARRREERMKRKKW